MSTVVILSLYLPDDRREEVLARLRELEANPALLGDEFPVTAVTVDEVEDVADGTETALAAPGHG